jgi:DNA replication protein DnaC
MANPDCTVCGGTGWVVKDHEGISAADRCECREQAQQEEKEERAQIPRNFRNASFDIKAPDNAILRNAIFNVRSYARNYKPDLNKPGLLLVGPTGTAKTHLAVAALRYLMGAGFEGVFFDYQNLLHRIYAGYSEALGTSNREAYQVALEADILVLDDLGATSNVNEWVEDTVTSIITYRYNNQKALIATTNLPDPDLGGHDNRAKVTLEDRIGARARSRLFEMCTVVQTWGAPDYRVEASKRG